MFIALTVVGAENQLYPNKIKASSKYSRQIVGVCDMVFDLFENLFLAYFAIGWLANHQLLDRQSPASFDDRQPDVVSCQRHEIGDEPKWIDI